MKKHRLKAILILLALLSACVGLLYDCSRFLQLWTPDPTPKIIYRPPQGEPWPIEMYRDSLEHLKPDSQGQTSAGPDDLQEILSGDPIHPTTTKRTDADGSHP